MVAWHGTNKNSLQESRYCDGQIWSNNWSRDERKELSIDLGKKEQYLRDSKVEQDRIRDIKKSVDYKSWFELRKSIQNLRKQMESYEDDLGELNMRRNSLEQKMLKDYNIKIYTKYGLFRSRRYDNICWTKMVYKLSSNVTIGLLFYYASLNFSIFLQYILKWSSFTWSGIIDLTM